MAKRFNVGQKLMLEGVTGTDSITVEYRGPVDLDSAVVYYKWTGAQFTVPLHRLSALPEKEATQ